MSGAAAARRVADERQHERRQKPRRQLTELERFERRCRKDPRLNSKGRHVWLVTALSGGPKATATMRPARMERELDATYWAAWNGLRSIDGLGLFKKTAAGYQRRGRPEWFVRRVRRHPGVNLKVRLLWFLVDITSAIATPDRLITKSIESIATELNSIPRRIRWTLSQLEKLDLVDLHFEDGRYIGCSLILEIGGAARRKRSDDDEW
jgi:hypothetical protein